MDYCILSKESLKMFRKFHHLVVIRIGMNKMVEGDQRIYKGSSKVDSESLEHICEGSVPK